MKRPLRPSLVTTAMPALAALLAACKGERPSVNPPPPETPRPTVAPDATPPLPEPVRVDPAHLPPMPLGGAPMPVTPAPPPPPQAAFEPRAAPSAAPSLAPSAAPAPAPALLAAPAPAPARALPAGVPANAEVGVWLVHNHPPGSPCRPVTRTEIEQMARIVQSATPR